MSDEGTIYFVGTGKLAPWIIGVVTFIFCVIAGFLFFAIAAAIRLHNEIEECKSKLEEEQPEDELQACCSSSSPG